MIDGHLVMARACPADVLVAKVEHDVLSMVAALDAARSGEWRKAKAIGSDG
jgi:hypothetical protein